MEQDNKGVTTPPVVSTLVRGPGGPDLPKVSSTSVIPPSAKPTNAQLYDSKSFAITNLVIAIVSLFIIPYMAYGSLSGSCIGIFYSFKNHSGWARKLTYLLTIVISITSLVLKALISRP